jgi:hypothetical protein
MVWFGVFLIGFCGVTAQAGEGKEKKKEKQAASAEAPSSAVTTAEPEKPKDKSGKKNKEEKQAAKSESDAGQADRETAKAEREAAKAARELAEAKEAGGDESELETLTQTLGLSDTQKKEVAKEFEKYRSRLATIKGLPESTSNEKLLKGPQRRALRDDLAKWVTGHVSPAQAQKFEAYEKKRRRDLYDEHVNNRVAKLTEAVGLNEAQQGKARTIYNVQLGGIQNAADELYAATQKAGTPTAALEKALEDKREAMKNAIQGVLKPEQLEQYKKMDD